MNDNNLLIFIHYIKSDFFQVENERHFSQHTKGNYSFVNNEFSINIIFYVLVCTFMQLLGLIKKMMSFPKKDCYIHCI